MRLSPVVEDGRITTGRFASIRGDPFGMFDIQGPCGIKLHIMAAWADDPAGQGWEHVSVSTTRRIPNWLEMAFVKRLFWASEDCVVQFHPPDVDHINVHPYCLHLWRWTGGSFPMPPKELIA
jgi:hypothetical protein